MNASPTDELFREDGDSSRPAPRSGAPPRPAEPRWTTHWRRTRLQVRIGPAAGRGRQDDPEGDDAL